MNVPYSTVKQFSSGTIASCPDDEEACHHRSKFRLKRRTCAPISNPKHVAERTLCWTQSLRSVRQRTDDFEFAPRTPPHRGEMKSAVIPPKLRLPSLDDDGDHRMTLIRMRNQSANPQFLNVSVALHHLFDAAATISEDDDCSSQYTLAENLFLPMLLE